MLVKIYRWQSFGSFRLFKLVEFHFKCFEDKRKIFFY